MGSLVKTVTGTIASNAVTISFSNVTTSTLITDTLFKDLGVKVNTERARRGRAADASIKDLADYTGVINYAELEKLRSAMLVSSVTNPTYKSPTNTNVTSPSAPAPMTSNPGVISAAGSWTGHPKITAALFNSLITGLKSQGNECTCNCNYCTCNCNYCTCNCNFSCTCNCNYSDVTTKENIVYM